jgi:hypothetical protein
MRVRPWDKIAAILVAVLLSHGVLSREFGFLELDSILVRTPGAAPFFSPIVDLNEDGIPDFVAGTDLYVGLGDGTFEARPLDVVPVAVTGVGDTDGDGLLDLLAIRPWTTGARAPSNRTLTIYTGLGSGEFLATENIVFGDGDCELDVPCLIQEARPVLGDFNNDGLADIFTFGLLRFAEPERQVGPIGIDFFDSLASLRLSPSRVSYPGFQHVVADEFATLFGFPLLADFNGDGFLDIAATQCNGETSGCVTVVLNERGLQPGIRYPTLPDEIHEPGTAALAAADADGDGDTDLLVLHRDAGGLSILVNAGGGVFEYASRVGILGHSLAVEDFDADGRPDALVSRVNRVEFLHDVLGGTPMSSVLIRGAVVGDREFIEHVQVGDLNGDGLLDVLVSRTLCERYDSPCRIQVFMGAVSRSFTRGDVNEDSSLGLTDALAILNSLFLGAGGPVCPDAADVDDDGQLLITDAVTLLNFLFLVGHQPPEPFVEPGTDPTRDELKCLRGIDR